MTEPRVHQLLNRSYRDNTSLDEAWVQSKQAFCLIFSRSNCSFPCCPSREWSRKSFSKLPVQPPRQKENQRVLFLKSTQSVGQLWAIPAQTQEHMSTENCCMPLPEGHTAQSGNAGTHTHIYYYTTLDIVNDRLKISGSPGSWPPCDLALGWGCGTAGGVWSDPIQAARTQRVKSCGTRAGGTSWSGSGCPDHLRCPHGSQSPRLSLLCSPFPPGSSCHNT